MNLQKLFNYQKEIEDNLSNLSPMSEDQLGESNILDLRFLALHIKVAELANLTKCYKYCEVRALPKDKLTLRYVDAFQYLLSIGNKFNYNVITYGALSISPQGNIIKQFSSLIEQISLVKKLTGVHNYMDGLNEYTKLFSMLINLGHTLKLSFAEVEQFLNSSRLSFAAVQI